MSLTLQTLQSYPEAQIPQGVDRRSAPTRHGHATGRDVPSAPSWSAGADDQLTNAALAAWFGARRCTRDKESPGAETSYRLDNCCCARRTKDRDEQ